MSASTSETTSAILETLKSQSSGCIWATELVFGQGLGGTRRCDFWRLNPIASKGFLAEAFEIKVSRTDFRRDTSVKQREARLFSNYFWYVAPKELIRPTEIPDWAGLKEWEPAADGAGHACLRIKVPAPYRDKDAPSWELVAMFIRSCGEIRRDTTLLQQELASLRWQVKRLRDELKQRSERDLSRFMNDFPPATATS